MNLILAGGCGEHGRNCFLLEGKSWNLLIDCGIKAGDSDPMPRLTREQISRTRYVLLTHSHKDHTGAAPWLIENGFTGVFVMTKETARQLPFTLPRAELLPTPETPCSIHLDTAYVTYGMSGHCAGAVWFFVEWEEKRIFFSGDYNFHSNVYAHHEIKNLSARAALLDSCYPGKKWSEEAFCSALKEALNLSGRVLLPVPKFGRALDILYLLLRDFPFVQVMADSHLQSELSSLPVLRPWLRPDAYEALKKWTPVQGKPDREDASCHVLLFSDPQLTSPVGRKVASIYAQEHYPILFSGSIDQGTMAEELIASSQGTVQILPVHNSDADYDAMQHANAFETVIPLHTPRKAHPSPVLL